MKVIGTPGLDRDYVLYDTQMAILNVFAVKPAVFDLVLSIVIACYLAFIYGALINSNSIVAFLTALIREMNGHSKFSNGVKNGQKLHSI